MQDCNNFLAGNMLRSSTRYRALEETAVFGSACRHEFPALFLNLKHGEKYVFSETYMDIQSCRCVQVLKCVLFL